MDPPHALVLALLQFASAQAEAPRLSQGHRRNDLHGHDDGSISGGRRAAVAPAWQQLGLGHRRLAERGV